MHIHVLGIGGTFMGGVAQLAMQMGQRVTGSDYAVYPPMSTQLSALGVDVMQGYDPSHLEPAPDLVIVGNALSRGNAAVEAVLDRGLKYTSGPQWLAETVLRDRWVVAVAGTHGKTTVSSLIAWILERAGLRPGFLIGGIPANFGVSARLGDRPFFVVEADEYDTAFFDKRSKFVHYRPRTAVLNNLEYDHADIFDDLQDIKRQFHHLVRTVPGNGRLIVNAADAHLREVLDMGCWSEVEFFADRARVPRQQEVETVWSVRGLRDDCGRFELLHRHGPAGVVEWPLLGRHNMANALAAVAAACHCGVPAATACDALASFRSVKRRLEYLGEFRGVRIYDDFAHHPTAIAETLAALRAHVGRARIVAVVEPRSNTMRMGKHRSALPAALSAADLTLLYRPADISWDVHGLACDTVEVHDSVDAMVDRILETAESGDHVVIMSNGKFDGLHQHLLSRLEPAMCG